MARLACAEVTLAFQKSSSTVAVRTGVDRQVFETGVLPDEGALAAGSLVQGIAT